MAELVAEVRVTLAAIRNSAGPNVDDPWVDPSTLAKSVTLGILDAPQLLNNEFARGRIRTRIIRGACLAVDDEGNPMDEKARLSALMQRKDRS